MSGASTEHSTLADELRATPEPTDLRRRLRHTIVDDPAGTRAETARLVAQRLARQWAPVLSPLGITPVEIRRWVASGDREAWLWIAGDRPWSQVIDALAGRVARRAGAHKGLCETPPS